MLFITAQQLPSFITWDTSSSSSSRPWLPRLKPRQVPISQWLLQVTTFASGTLLNNLVFAFSVPPTIQIVFRSAGKKKTKNPFLSPPPSPVLSPWIRHAESFGLCANRAGRVHDPRPRLHGQAIHAATNCTSPSPFSLPSNGAPPRMLTLISPAFPCAPPLFFYKGRRSRSLVRRHLRDALPTARRLANYARPNRRR
jgi:hypothetical protein